MKTKWFCFVLDWGGPSLSKIAGQILFWCQVPFHISEIKCRFEKREVRGLFQAGYLGFLWSICGVPTLKHI